MISSDPILISALAEAQQGERNTYEGEYTSGETVYVLAGGVLKSGNPQFGIYTFVFETIACSSTPPNVSV